jgi:anti-sigma regulatory factor (Ser/Thr protein kinase)
VPEIEVTFSPLPAHVRTARLVATAVARRAGVDEALLDEIRLAVGEACSRAVGLHLRRAPEQAVRVLLGDDEGIFSVEVIDLVPDDDDGTPDVSALFDDESADADPYHDPLLGRFGLAVVEGLVEQLEVTSDGPTTKVRMTWPAGKSAAESPLAS